MKLHLMWLIGLLVILGSRAESLTIQRLNQPQQWKLLEFRISGVPAASNPFDPDQIALDATFTLPSGATRTVPGFWYQAYKRSLQNGTEVLAPTGQAQWRVRFCPTQAGSYTVSVALTVNGAPAGTPASAAFTVASSTSAPPHGYVRTAGGNNSFQTDQGDALPLRGADVCWYHSGGTYDYDHWFAKMHQAGENYARIWMCPWAFGIECDPNTLTNYRLDHAWQLDYTLNLADHLGLYLTLCLDYHGMFETKPDYWGGNNYWPQNPYNAANGGPCSVQDDFFTLTAAQKLYQKRLRYLIARYGYSTHLLAWEFFNEIDNEYAYLNPTDVANWHASMGQWLHQADPFGHLVTTSLTGGSDRPEIWSLTQLDFVNYHSYGAPQPALQLDSTVQTLLAQYQKPAMIEEYGVDWRGWNRQTVDPYLRGFRQGIWTGALSGSVGTAMSWWWEDLDAENLYPYYGVLSKFESGSSLGGATSQPVTFARVDELSALGNPIPNGKPFTATLNLDTGWGDVVPGELALANPARAALGPVTFNSFVQGSWHEDLRQPFKIAAWLGANAQLVMHLNSVSDDAVMEVLVDGNLIYSWAIPNKDGQHVVDNEYNIDVPVALPSGKHTIEIYNGGGDWFYLDWVRIENALPAQYTGSPYAIGLTGTSNETLVYVVNPIASWPINALTQTIPALTGSMLQLTNWPAGSYQATWYSPVSGKTVGVSSGTTVNGTLILSLPAFKEDLAGQIFKQ